MISRRTLFGLLAVTPVAAIAKPVHSAPAFERGEPEWDDSDRPEGGGVWHVKWFNRVRGFGFVRNDAGEEMRIDKAVIRASGIELSEMRPGRSFVIRWTRDERANIAMSLRRV